VSPVSGTLGLVASEFISCRLGLALSFYLLLGELNLGRKRPPAQSMIEPYLE